MSWWEIRPVEVEVNKLDAPDFVHKWFELFLFTVSVPRTLSQFTNCPYVCDSFLHSAMCCTKAITSVQGGETSKQPIEGPGESEIIWPVCISGGKKPIRGNLTAVVACFRSTILHHKLIKYNALLMIKPAVFNLFRLWLFLFTFRNFELIATKEWKLAPPPPASKMLRVHCCRSFVCFIWGRSLNAGFVIEYL